MDEGVFTPLLLKPILERFGSQIVAVYLSTGLSRKFVRRNLKQLLSCALGLLQHPIELMKLFLRLRTEQSLEPRSMLSELGVPIDMLKRFDIDSQVKLAEHDADIFLFCPFNLIAGPRTLAIPRLGVFNSHLGRIPEYKGGFSAFWVLRNNDPVHGATLHRAVTRIDEGEIINEVRFTVETKSLFELMKTTFSMAGSMVANGIQLIVDEDNKKIDSRGRTENYFLIPRSGDVRAFFKNGAKLV